MDLNKIYRPAFERGILNKNVPADLRLWRGGGVVCTDHLEKWASAGGGVKGQRVVPNENSLYFFERGLVLRLINLPRETA
jgi:hypothetical protein